MKNVQPIMSYILPVDLSNGCAWSAETQHKGFEINRRTFIGISGDKMK